MEFRDDEVAALKQAIDTNNIDLVKTLMTANPALHQAPLGYGEDGPLTWVAECRVPWEPPSPARLAMAQWMVDNGSDVHQGGDGPLGRAALNGHRIPMMELLVRNGADVNAEWKGDFPILWFPCESVDPDVIEWLLDRGANPNTSTPSRCDTALDYLLGTYGRSEELPRCIELLLKAGGTTRYDVPGVLDILRNKTDNLATKIDKDPELIHQRFPELDFGSTGARGLLLTGATLLHVAAEFANIEAATLLLDRGADVNVRAEGGQTPIFHSVSQFDDFGLEMTEFLLDRGADLTIRAKIQGHYDRPDEMVDCNPVEYAELFPGDELPNEETLRLLHSRIAGSPAGN